MHNGRVLISLLAMFAAGGCGSAGGAASAGTSPTAPTPVTSVAPTLGGTYSGDASDSSGPGAMTWNLGQTGTTVTGTVTATTAKSSVGFSGTLLGTFAGTTLTFTIAVSPGGVTLFRSCTMSIEGMATNVSATVIAGTYSGSSSCAPAFTNGRFSLSGR